MTFLEAAMELLKQARKPLHFSKLAELAQKRDLLDHVGRDPETAMQTALANALKKGVPDLLVRVKPGVFGLRHYPAPSAAEAEKEKKEEAASAAPAEKKKRSRSRRGKGKKEVAEAAKVAAAPPPPPAPEPEPEVTVAAEATPPPVEAAPPLAEAAPAEPKTFHMPDDEEEEEDEAPPTATPGAPVFSASPNGQGAAPGFSDERRGRRRRRRRRGRGGGELGGGLPPFDKLGGGPGAAPTPMQSQQPAFQQPAAAPLPPPPPSVTPTGERVFGLADAAYEILRTQQDGRPMHVKQITDMAISRKLVKPDGHDLWRSVRVALQQEIRERTAQGLRPRIRFAGGALFSAADRRVDGELLAVERQLSERLDALRRATRQAMVRRLGRLNPPAFDTIGKLLLERLGFGGLETVKRTTEALYVAASRPRGGADARTLVSIRAGAEQGRRAVGELRAGVLAKGMTDGLLVSAGRLLPDTSAEAGTAGPPVELWDGEHVAGQMIKLGIGLVRTVMPIEYMDADFFADLSEN